MGDSVHHVSEDIRGAVTGFIVCLCKGLVDDPRWDWDVDVCDWQNYQAGFADSSILRTTIAVFMNALTLDGDGSVLNYPDARFRAFQYFRMLVDRTYKPEIEFSMLEMEEPDWRIWEN